MFLGNSLVVQWLGLCAFTAAFTAEGLSSIPGGGTKIPPASHTAQPKRFSSSEGKISLRLGKKIMINILKILVMYKRNINCQ